MTELKSIETLLSNTEVGDLISISLLFSNLVGYRWSLDKGTLKERLIGSKDYDLLLCSLDPYGNSGHLLEQIQFVGVNTKTRRVGDREIEGYKLIEKRIIES